MLPSYSSRHQKKKLRHDLRTRIHCKSGILPTSLEGLALGSVYASLCEHGSPSLAALELVGETQSFREQKLNPNFFFSNFSGAPGISRQNPGISRPKSLISLFSRDVSNFFAPTRSRGRPPPHWKISGPESLGLGSFFLPDHWARNRIPCTSLSP